MGVTGHHGPKPRQQFAVIPGQGRPNPPPGVHKLEAKIWRRIVDSMPDGYFGPEVQPLLRCLCSHIATSEVLQVKITQLRDQEDWEQLDQVTRLMERASKMVGEISTKLRLTPKSKWGQEVASTKQALNSAKKPWNLST